MAGLSIVTNAASLGAQRNLGNANDSLLNRVSKLSSGLRITRSGDDAAGLGVSEKLKAQIRGLGKARQNAQDAISITQTAEGAMGEIQGIVTRMRELAVQAANGTLSNSEREFLDTEFTQLRSEIDRIGNVTEFNGVKLLVSGQSGMTMQVGVKNSGNDRITISVASTHAANLGAAVGASTIEEMSVGTVAAARLALDVLDLALHDLSERRATLGAAQQRFSVTLNNLGTAHENLSAANSRIRDVDVADETAAYTRDQILTQAGVSVLAQANQLPAVALSLIG